MAETPPKLTAKQALFCKEYLVDLNATQAAIRAGYKAKSACVIGGENLRKPAVAAEVQRLMDERAGKIGITADNVLQELAKLAFVNVQDLYDSNGAIKPITELPRHVAASIQSVKVNVTDGGAVQEVKLWDKKGSLELLGKHLVLFADKQKEDENTPAPTKVEIVVQDARKG